MMKPLIRRAESNPGSIWWTRSLGQFFLATVLATGLSPGKVQAWEADPSSNALGAEETAETESPPIPPDRPLRVSRVLIEYDQDHQHANWFVTGQDHAYTGGFQLYVGLLGSAVDHLAKKWLWDRPGAQYASGAGIKLRVFTPDAVTRFENPGPEERPYAGWLTSSFGVQQRTARVEDFVGLELGVVGPSSGAATIQQTVHPAVGWSTQLRDEITINLRLRRAWKVNLASQPGRDFAVEAIPEAAIDVGTVYRRIITGMTLRAGLRLPEDFMTTRIDDPGSLSGATEPWSAFFFVRGSLHLVQHNIFLDGNTWTESRSVEREPVVGELEVGAMLQFGRRAGLQWSWTTLSDEFETDPINDSYGTVLLRFNL